MATQKVKVSRARAKAVAVQPTELDGTYFLKLVLYLIVGSLWFKITTDTGHIPLPVGLVIGLFFTRYEKFQIDKKIEYAILLAAMLVGYFAPLGLYIRL